MCPLQKGGINMNQQYVYNKKIFDSWNEKSAYLLGWLATDGCVQYVPNKRYGLRWELSDLDAIEMIKDILDSDYPIHKRNPGSGNLYSLYIRGKYITQRAINLGISPKKSLTLKFPPVPKKQIKHFLRGVFDGDGSAFFLNRKEGKVLGTKFCGASKEFIQKIGEILREELEIIPKIYSENNDSFWTLRYGASESISLLKYLYEDCQYFLKRKQEILDEALRINAGNKVATCNRCGKEIVRVSNRQKWCKDCKIVVVREQDRKRRRTHDK